MPEEKPGTGKLIALTGATGFVGQFLLHDLMRRGYRLRVLLRRPVDLPLHADSAVIGDLTRPQNMSEALKGVDAVVHSAGLAHTMSGLPEDDYRAINTEATTNLARAAERAGVRRFVFLSSIRAQCGPTSSEILCENSPEQPTDAYGRSKLAAEKALSASGIDWVALRPVLVYGPGVKGNMAALLELARGSWPLPLGALKGKRSILAVQNLADAVDMVLRAEGPLRRPLIVADAEPCSIGDMVKAMRRGFGRTAGLIPVPEGVMKIACLALGRREAFERVAGSLSVRSDGLKALGWQPPVATAAALEALARQLSSDA